MKEGWRTGLVGGGGNFGGRNGGCEKSNCVAEGDLGLCSAIFGGFWRILIHNFQLTMKMGELNGGTNGYKKVLTAIKKFPFAQKRSRPLGDPPPPRGGIGVPNFYLVAPFQKPASTSSTTCAKKTKLARNARTGEISTGRFSSATSACAPPPNVPPPPPPLPPTSGR